MSIEHFIQLLQNTFFSAAYGTVTKTGHILGQKQASANIKKQKL
jgi:hypothetical protein